MLQGSPIDGSEMIERRGPVELGIGNGDFAACDVCGSPAALIVPSHAALAGQRLRFCRITCLKDERTKPEEPEHHG
jgi:hypothetical protein